MGERISATEVAVSIADTACVADQIEAVARSIDDVELALHGRYEGVLSGLARLTFDWGLLQAQLERCTSILTAPDAVLDLWAAPLLDRLRDRLRCLLRVGVIYSQHPDTSLGVTAQIYQLAGKLITHEATWRAIRGEPSAPRSELTDYRVECGPA